MIIEICSWLKLKTEAGMSQLLSRLRISFKRGRDYVHSPDKRYKNKLGLIELRRLRAYYAPDRFAFLYMDELTYYRQPEPSQAYEEMGLRQPLACRYPSSNNHFRVVGAINAITGQLTYRQRSKANVACLTGFWQDVRDDYPDAEQIYIVVDNWPMHFHPDVLSPLQPQHFPFPPKLSRFWSNLTWPSPERSGLPIQLLCLPTYASWLNPIEKLWRWLKQQVLYFHPKADNWPGLRQEVDEFLAQFTSPSDDLLTYVGLLPN